MDFRKTTLLKFLFILVLSWSCAKDDSSTDDPNDGYQAPPLEAVDLGLQEFANRPLQVKSFRNGEPIYQATSAAEWNNAAQSETPAWCYRDYDPANQAEGLYYNAYAVRDSRGLAPSGWIIPSEGDFNFIHASLRYQELQGNLSLTGVQDFFTLLQSNFGMAVGANTYAAEPDGQFGQEGRFWTATPTSTGTSQAVAWVAPTGTALGLRPQNAGHGFQVLCMKANNFSESNFLNRTWNLATHNFNPPPYSEGNETVLNGRMVASAAANNNYFFQFESDRSTSSGGNYTQDFDFTSERYWGNGLIMVYERGTAEFLYYRDGKSYHYMFPDLDIYE